MNKKKFFVVSDIHGHYSLLKKELDEAGFDENNPDHIFVCCGDLFDRGRENRKVFDYVMSLKHCVLVRGNHDERLAEVLTARRADIYDLHNGLAVTLEEFFGIGSVGEFGELRLPCDRSMIEKIFDLMGRMVDYYETENYVFVHGWLPTEPGVHPPRIVEDWRHADSDAWRRSRFSEWLSLYRTPAMLCGKTIVCGHRPTRLWSRVDQTRDPRDSSIFYGEGMIAIDAGTIRSGRVNLLVIEDRELAAE